LKWFSREIRKLFSALNPEKERKRQFNHLRRLIKVNQSSTLREGMLNAEAFFFFFWFFFFSFLNLSSSGNGGGCNT